MKYKALLALIPLTYLCFSTPSKASDSVSEFSAQGDASSALLKPAEVISPSNPDTGTEKIVQAVGNENYGTNKNIGTVGLDVSSFLYSSGARDNSYTTFEATFDGKFDSRIFRGQGDLQAYSFVKSNPDYNVESRELYLTNQDDPKKAAFNWGPSHVTVGRRYYEWSKVDQVWDMMSLWSPRFTWDPIHPETIGMTGAFYNFDYSFGGTKEKKDRVNFLFFISPLAIPERGTNTKEDNGNLVSSNPFWVPLPRHALIYNQDTPIRYTLQTPPLDQILFRLNGAAKLTYEDSTGFWGSLGGGILPVHMVGFSAETALNTSSTNGEVDVIIHPQFPLRSIYTLEGGFANPDKSWDVWGSASYEHPFNFDNNPLWLNSVLTPARIISVGTNVKLTSNFWFNGSALFVHEDAVPASTSNLKFDVNLPSRFPLKQGIKLGGTWKHSLETESHFAWTQDLIVRSHLISADVEHAFKRYGILVGVGADVLVDNTTKGWLGQYYGDDRVRGWFKYAF
jgi:hypothetical protein